MIGEWINHLWQSTIFATAVALLTLAFRRNRAQVRYWLWLSASFKFLVPFAPLMTLGNALWGEIAARRIATEIAPPTVSLAMTQIARPFTNTVSSTMPVPSVISWTFLAVFVVWVCGFATILFVRLQRWQRIRTVVLASTPINIPAAVEIRSSASLLEPGIVGFFRPLLLLPDGILKTLTAPQLETVLAHELCHIRRRDNLTAALHMIVEAIFWFHPFVWWIGGQLVAERERACDEEVLQLGNEPQVYAESILRVCQFYAESPLTCVSGVTGSDLKRRIARIARNHVGEALGGWRKLFLITAAVAALALPLFAGMLTGSRPAPQLSVSVKDKPSFDVVTIRLNKSGDQGTYLHSAPGGLYRATNASLRVLIASAYLSEFPPKGRLIFGGPDWIDSERFDIEAKSGGNPGTEQERLMLQSLLEERFKLVLRRETRQLPIYALVLSRSGKTGPQFVPHSVDAKCTDPEAGQHLQQPGPGEVMPAYCGGFFMSPRPGDLRESGNRITMSMLAPFLGQSVDRTVVDQTGLSGVFDFTLEFAPELGPGSQAGATGSDPSARPSIFTALQEQLGLKLESQTRPVDSLVIDHVERPPEN